MAIFSITQSSFKCSVFSAVLFLSTAICLRTDAETTQPTVNAKLVKESEQTALDGLLAITEAQTRFAVRNGRYAVSIAELGFQNSVISTGQLTMKAAYDADLDNPQRIAAMGYYFRILPVSGKNASNESNSFWAVAIPDSRQTNLPVYFTVAYRIKTIAFPLVDWWALRLHGQNRFAIADLFVRQSAVSLHQIGLNYDKPESFPKACVIRRFTLDRSIDYPPAEMPRTPIAARRTLALLIGGIAVVTLILLLRRIPKTTKRRL